MKQMKYFLAPLLLCLLVITIQAQTSGDKLKIKQDSVFNSLAATPPMGWNSWNKFGCKLNEKLLMKWPMPWKARG